MESTTSTKAPGQGAKAAPAPPKSLGPVPSLAEHVQPDWWRSIFNSVYLKTDGDVVDDDRLTSAEVEMFVKILGLRTDDRVLDLCCGQGRHTLELARRGFMGAEGVDRSHYLIQKAKSQARKESLGIRFREGDARKLPYQPDSFDSVMILGNSFGYFETMQEDLMVLKEVLRTLRPWGRVLLDVADGDFLRDNFQPRSWEWIDRKHFVCRERSLSVGGQRLVSREIVSQVERGVLSDQFYAVRLYNRQAIEGLLKEAGFSDIAFHGEISTFSQRNQDLGMMAERIIVTASVRKPWTPRRRSREATRNVAVVMGDPTKPDDLKPFCVFDDDDFYTIDRMKSALDGLKGYRFEYLSDHDRLVHDLTRLRGRADLVLNLCDEGFGNNPRHELHVPALLDVLGLPYTGAGPQCLAFCYDKSLVRGVAQEMGVPVASAFFVNPEDPAFDFVLSFPVIVKPNFGDSSFGITQRSVAGTPGELMAAITEIRQRLGYEKPILVEEFLTGADITVGVIGNPPESYTVLPIVEEDYSALPEGLPRLCGYEAKWMPDSPYWKITSKEAELPPDTEKAVVEWCLKLFERLECRDYARFDWRLDAEGTPRLLEVNPNPGWCWDGHLAKMSKVAGIPYPEMLKLIVQAAEQRLNLQAMQGAREEHAQK